MAGRLATRAQGVSDRIFLLAKKYYYFKGADKLPKPIQLEKSSNGRTTIRALDRPALNH
jgi:hypothetical protein